VSGKLGAGTIGTGTVNLCISQREDNANTNAYWRVHIYVTSGDSDTVRGTLLDQYAEDTTNELPVSTNTASALQSAQSLSSVVVSDGDRIVVEIGCIKRGATTSNTLLVYGFAANPVDCAVGDESWSANKVGWIEFSENLPASTTISTRVTHGPVEVTIDEDTAPAARVSQGVAEIALDEDTAPAARVSQGVAEVVIASTNDAQRVTQVVVEYPVTLTTTERLSQLVAEVLSPVVVETRLTQLLLEIANGAVNETRVTQEVIELLGRTSTYCGDPSVSFATLCGKPDVLAWLEWTVPMKEN
jgi:hypothetical protein